MEKKTNKQNLKFSNFWENQFYGGNYALSANSTKNMLIRVILHAEFIPAVKIVENPTIFMKNAKKKK